MMRTFKVVDAKRQNKCDTKFKSGRYTGKSPVDAALKAFNQLCRVKKIRGVCTLVMTVQETTRNSEGKLFSYKLNRMKLKKPLVRFEGTDKEYVIKYKNVAKSVKVDSLPKCKRTDGKSSGVMKAFRKKSKKVKATSSNKKTTKKDKLFGLF
jgi:hypothetical protein